MKILFVGWPVCIHTLRWIQNIPKQGFELHLYVPAEDALSGPALHEKMRKGLKLSIPERVEIHYPKTADDPRELAKYIELTKPDLIHSMPIHIASHLVYKAKKVSKSYFPPWFVSAWGMSTEVLFAPWIFGLSSKRRSEVTEVLGSCDYLFAESKDCIALAESLGFKGAALQVGTVAGGFDIPKYLKFRSTPPSKRRLVLLKGYQHIYGRALTALKAFELCATELKHFQIGICAAAPSVELAAQLLRKKTKLNISILPFYAYSDWLRLLGKARVSVGNNSADGRPNAMSEAMLMGAFPIQSNTAYTKGWLHNKLSGMLVPHDNPQKIAAALKIALTDDALVDSAADINLKIIETRLSQQKVQHKVVQAYRKTVGELN